MVRKKNEEKYYRVSKLRNFPRNHELKIRLSKNEVDKLQQRADEIGLKISQYVRVCSLHSLIDIKLDKIIVL